MNGKLILLGGVLPWGREDVDLYSQVADALFTTTLLPFSPNFAITWYSILWQTILSSERVYRYMISP